MAELIGGATAIVSINSVALSDHATAATLEITYDDVDTTAFGDSVRTRIAGLGDATVNITWNQDYASSEIDATFNGIVGTAVAFELTPTSASVSATNPKYSGSLLVTSYTPIAAEVGALSTITTSWPVTGAITRATS
tara:strand:- start:696 stop:1106 length:411 start_codon:yes stop_codon:yes gene_type:complete